MIDELPVEDLKKIDWNPTRDENVITIIKQKDGNYRGFMQKNGRLVQMRQGDPNTVLNLLLTSE